jgi:hypothetical protein
MVSQNLELCLVASFAYLSFSRKPTLSTQSVPFCWRPGSAIGYVDLLLAVEVTGYTPVYYFLKRIIVW